MSTASHRPRPITPATTVALALLAAVITVWLGLVAHFGGMLHDGSAQTAAICPTGSPWCESNQGRRCITWRPG